MYLYSFSKDDIRLVSFIRTKLPCMHFVPLIDKASESHLVPFPNFAEQLQLFCFSTNTKGTNSQQSIKYSDGINVNTGLVSDPVAAR